MSYTQEQLDQAAGMDRPNIVTYPTIKFTATNTGRAEVGSFSFLTSDENGELQAEDLGKELKAVIINRGRIRLKNAQYISNEVSGARSKVMLFTKDGGKLQDQGDYYKIKEQYGLSTFQHPYLKLEDGRIGKLIVLPASLNNFWDYMGGFRESDRVYYYWTHIKASEEAKSGKGGSYYVIEFGQGDQLTQEEQNQTYESIMKVANAIQKNDEARKGRYQEEAEEVQEPAQEHPQEQNKDDIPVIENDIPQEEDQPNDQEKIPNDEVRKEKYQEEEGQEPLQDQNKDDIPVIENDIPQEEDQPNNQEAMPSDEKQDTKQKIDPKNIPF